MAISVVSSTSTLMTTSPALPGMPTADSTAGGFADLLFSQLGSTVNTLPGLSKAATTSDKKTTEKEVPTDLTTQAIDPALAFLMAAANPQPPIPDNTSASNASTTILQSTATKPAWAEPVLNGDILSRIGKPGDDTNPQATAQGNSTIPSASPSSETDVQRAAFTPPVMTAALANQSAISNSQSSVSNSKSPASSTGEPSKKTLEHSSALSVTAASEKTPAPSPEIIDRVPFQNILASTEKSAPSGDGNALPTTPANIAVEPSVTGGHEALPTLNAIPLQHVTAETAPPGKQEVSTPLQSSAWSHDFASKVVWLAKNDQQQVQININPPQLGPIEISLHVSGDQASAAFGSANAEVRQAIESSLPQLKEMFASAGINLGHADVGANMAQQNREAQQQSTNGNRLANENAILPGDGNAVNSKTSTLTQRGRGLVDLFA